MKSIKSVFKNLWNQYETRQINAWLIFFLLIYFVIVIKIATLQQLETNWLFGLYSLGVSFYILSRFALAYFHAPEITKFDRSFTPTISFAVPSKNEEENIYETIIRIANSKYPKGKFDIIAVNDGSTDKTLQEMLRARSEAQKLGVFVQVIDWKKNRGKREGMAECVRRSKNDVIIFIDSDSFVKPTTARELIKYFIDPRVGAVAGHGNVANADTNMLTKMQAVRYFVSFKAYKGAESLFGNVTCCSGCCSAYRRTAVLEVLDDWAKQEFLGIRCTYGDDRSLTNFLLKKDYITLYAPEAVAYTIVPDHFSKFMKQQLRWKKSWVRENWIAGQFMWRRNPIMSLSFYLGVVLPLAAPIIVARALIWYPYASGNTPIIYLLGLILMAVIYGLYYYMYTKDTKWMYGVIFATFYTLVLVWQLPYAIINLRDARWGTR